MGIYGYHLLQDDRAYEILDAIRAEFDLPCGIPCGPEESGWRDTRRILDSRGAEILDWILSSRFTRKTAAPFKPYRVVVAGAALLETGADVGPKVRDRVTREASYLSSSYPGSTAHSVYAMRDLVARMRMHVPGMPTLLAETTFDAVVRDAVHDPFDPAALANHRASWWSVARNGEVSFSQERAAYAAIPIGSPGDGWRPPASGDDQALWADVERLMEKRPPFNLRLDPEYALWADNQALCALRARGEPGGVPLVGLRNRLVQVDALLALHVEPPRDVLRVLH